MTLRLRSGRARAGWSMVGAILLAALATVYVTRLAVVPGYLMHDEVNFALQADAIARTAHDTNGRLLPVYFSETGFEAGRDPLMIYWTALFLAVLPLDEVAVRLPTAILGLISVGLMWCLARRFFRSDALGVITAVMLGLTPAFFTNARLALSIVYPIPFVIAWLYCVLRAHDEKSYRWAIAAGAVLGAGIYSYLAAMIVMPLLLLITVSTFVREGRLKHAGAAAAAFAAALLPLVAWVALHPERFSALAGAYQVGGSPSLLSLRDRVSVYWRFFSPQYLFIQGDGRLTNSTRAAGLFPAAFAILAPIGVYGLFRRRAPAGIACGLGCLLAPVASALSGHLEINRVLIAVPFGVIAAGAGYEWLAMKGRAARMCAGLLVALVPLQFAGFYADYAGEYRVRSAPWFGGDNKTAIAMVLDRIMRQPQAVFLSRTTPIERYWRFYASAAGRGDLADLPTYYDPAKGIDESSGGSLVICQPPAPACSLLGTAPGWSKLGSVALPDGTVTHEIYEHQ